MHVTVNKHYLLVTDEYELLRVLYKMRANIPMGIERLAFRFGPRTTSGPRVLPLWSF